MRDSHGREDRYPCGSGSSSGISGDPGMLLISAIMCNLRNNQHETLIIYLMSTRIISHCVTISAYWGYIIACARM